MSLYEIFTNFRREFEGLQIKQGLIPIKAKINPIGTLQATYTQLQNLQPWSPRNDLVWKSLYELLYKWRPAGDVCGSIWNYVICKCSLKCNVFIFITIGRHLSLKPWHSYLLLLYCRFIAITVHTTTLIEKSIIFQ